MLKNIPAFVSPDLIYALNIIGHGSRIMVCDANCDFNTIGHDRCYKVRLDGIRGPEVVKAILDLIPLDDYIEDPIRLSTPEDGRPIPPCFEKYDKVFIESEEAARFPHLKQIPRYEDADFWREAKPIDLVIATGETDPYGNIFIQKGVIIK